MRKSLSALPCSYVQGYSGVRLSVVQNTGSVVLRPAVVVLHDTWAILLIETRHSACLSFDVDVGAVDDVLQRQCRGAYRVSRAALL